MRKLLAFIFWILINIGLTAKEYYQEYRYNIRRNPWVTLVGTTLLTLFFSLCMLGVGVMVTGSEHMGLAFMQVTLLAGLILFVYTGVSAMYATFKEERRELFETIKQSK